MSRIPSSIGRDPFSASPRTPGSLGYNDAADPNRSEKTLGDTPGSLGICDHAGVTCLAGPVVKESEYVPRIHERNYFGPGGALITKYDHFTYTVRNIPLVPQLSAMSCWVAVGKMVLGYVPSVEPGMWIPKKPPKKELYHEIGGLHPECITDPKQLQKFMNLNGLILYPGSKWTAEGIESRLRTRSAFFYFTGIHAVAIAGIKFNHNNPNSSKVIIYDPMPENKGSIYDEKISTLLERVKSAREYAFSNSETALQWKKHGWYGGGSYFLHR